MILQVSESGELVVPPALVQKPPHTQVQVEHHGETLVIKTLVAQPEEDLAAFWETFPAFPTCPADPLATFRREDIYDDDGR